MTPEQVAYVKEQLAKGVEPEDLKATMMQHGYSEGQVSALFAEVQNKSSELTVPTEPVQPASLSAPHKGSSKTFLYVAIGVLSVLLIGIGIWQFFTYAIDRGVSYLETEMEEQIADITIGVELLMEIDELAAGAEEYKVRNGTYSGFCQEVSNPEIVCQSATETYRMGFTAADESEYCTDSTGFKGEIKAGTATNVCMPTVEPEDVPAESTVLDAIQTEPNKIETIDDVGTESPETTDPPISPVNQTQSLSDLSAADRSLVSDVYQSQGEIALFLSFEGRSSENICNMTTGNVQCVSEGEQYQLHTLLTNGSYFCADSVGFEGLLSNKPVGFTCN